MNLWSNGFIMFIVVFLGTTHRNGWFNTDIGISMGVRKNLTGLHETVGS